MAGGELDAGFSWRSFLHTDQPIIWTAQKVHGITAAQLQHAPRLLSLWPRLNATLRGRVVVSHGAGTEKRFLRAFPLHGFGPWVDTLKVAQAAVPDARDFSLEALCDFLGLTAELHRDVPGFQFHDALCDSVAALRLLWRIVQLAELGDAPVDALIDPQRSAYFQRKRRERPFN
jgi:DNA polymerase-3 subunit epsilon